MDLITDPGEIEKRSFEIITQLLGDKPLGPNASIIKRVIHTTADLDFLENLVFTENVLERAISVLNYSGFHVVTDTRMAEAGINKRILAQFGGSVHCFIDAPEVVQKAKETNMTRSAVAVEYALRNISGPTIFIVGNAPTALLKLCEVIEQGICLPELVVAVPVGFVNVIEAKEKILELDVPSIVARGRKGGSNVAAAIVNAIMYEAKARRTG
ncbi:MAG TPA: precorrin-8X methylmutase [Planctomycetaceae bacterium]|nr:precorrin-8X methylmutase [Planctomycetaceae bacterium]